MQLCYRGVRYESKNITLPTVESSHSAKFRGCRYSLRQEVVKLKSYWRVSDRKEIKFTFLGQIYYRMHSLI